MDYLQINKTTWDTWTKVHVESSSYDVTGFLNGQSSLNDIELTQVGCVEGKTLLHLQCHFGQDTLSWARLGAKVTGVDLSAKAIEQASSLAAQLNIDAVFIEKDIIQFGLENKEQFDIVFTSYGVLCWLPDLTLWAKTIASALKPGGEFHLVEFHSFKDLLDGYSYFYDATPDIEDDVAYTENADDQKSKMVTWGHSLGEIITALIEQGLSIEAFKEYPYSPYGYFDGVEEVPGKGYQLLYKGQQVPLVFSIKARKPD